MCGRIKGPGLIGKNRRKWRNRRLGVDIGEKWQKSAYRAPQVEFDGNGRNGRRWVKFVEIGGREKFLKENTDFCSESLVNLTKPGPVVYGD